MRPFTPFVPEEKEIVEEALHYTRNKIRVYHSDWIRNSPSINTGEIDKERSKYDKYINNILTLLSDPKKQKEQKVDSDWLFIDEHILSALSIYSKELEKAIDPDLPSSKKRFSIVKRLLESQRFKGVLSNLWNKYYDGYGVQDRGNNRLLFFSYSSKDRKVIGKISEILQKEYNYRIFRAHETDSIDIDANWRSEIKDNLNKCDGLIAYVTRYFRNSAWTQQECGWVMGRGKPIFSIFKMKKIPGFLEEKQGIRVNSQPDYNLTAEAIHDFIDRYYSISR